MGSKDSGPSDADRDNINEAELERVLKYVPRGTVAIAGLAVALTLLGWLIIYFGVFIPRGVVN